MDRLVSPDQSMDTEKMYNSFDMIIDMITGSAGPEAMMRLLDRQT